MTGRHANIVRWQVDKFKIVCSYKYSVHIIHMHAIELIPYSGLVSLGANFPEFYKINGLTTQEILFWAVA